MLGAGVMGAQIAAHLVNCRVPVVLFDLASKEGPKSGIALKAIDNLKKLKPAPLGVAEDAALIEPANYEEHLALLGECDLVIEAIAERMDWKLDLYTKIAPHVPAHALLASNTSGLSITKLSAALPEAIRPRFCGIHFFNPPRYMALVELIDTPTTEPRVLDELEAFVTTYLGKSVVRAKDTPNFIANRVGIAGMLATIKEAENFGLTYDVVDDLTGKKMGRASSGTFRTADVVGLDTMAHVIKTLQDNLANDPFFPSYATPPVLEGLIKAGALGQKTGAGFYKKVGKDILRLDPAKRDYVPGGGKADPIVERMLKKPAAERLKLLRESEQPAGAVRLGDPARRVPLRRGAPRSDRRHRARRRLRDALGLRHEAGPVRVVAGRRLAAGGAVGQGGHRGRQGIVARRRCRPGCSTAAPACTRPRAPGARPARPTCRNRRCRSICARTSPRRCWAPVRSRRSPSGTELFRNDEVRVWTLDGEVVIASITAKLHLISPTVTDGLLKALEIAEGGYQGLVIWSPDDVFSAGANLESLMPVFMKLGAKGIAPEEKKLQDMMLRIRYAQVPVVSAIRGLALGGGCELAAYSARRVAAMESYIGLVEVGVGLIPGGGGLAYIARRAAEMAAAGNANADIFAFVKDGFTSAAMAKVGTSAIESKKLGYLQDGDVIVPHKDELLYVATQQAKALFAAGYRPPVKRLFPVAGRSGIATIKGQLANMRDGGFISAHDFHISALIADVVCGGEVDAGSLVSEEYLMALERKHFCSLLEHPKTQERIMGMLSTGKPVRN